MADAASPWLGFVLFELVLPPLHLSVPSIVRDVIQLLDVAALSG